MVFFTSILIVVILYFLQADGLIYVTIIALTAELVNIFLTHTVAKSVEKKLNNKHRRSVEGYIKQLRAGRKQIKELEKIREDAGRKLYKSNVRLKELESQIRDLTGKDPNPPAQPPEDPPAPDTETAPDQAPKAPPKVPPPTAEDHLPAGSGRKPPPT